MGAILEMCARGPCLPAILSETDVHGCLDTCMQSTAAGDLSPGFRGCFIDNVICVRQECLLICLNGTDQECFDCSETKCGPFVDLCLGYPRL